MIQVQLKLKLTKAQEIECERWLFHLASVYNWAIRKIELNAKDKIYFSPFDFKNLLVGHSVRLEIPSMVIQGTLATAYLAWSRCFKGLAGKPQFKSSRNKMTSIPFSERIKIVDKHIKLFGLGKVKFHRQDVPKGKLKAGRIVKRASGWYLSVAIEAERESIEQVSFGEIGIDPGFTNLLTTSAGEIIEHPREFECGSVRLAQAKRGRRKQLTARIQERIRNRRKDRNHKLSLRLCRENALIAFSKDRSQGIAKRFGKSVASSGHYQLRQMLAYKSPKSGTQFVEVDSRNSTKTCSVCGAQSGPTGLSGLAVRQWTCTGCGTSHDRDVNAAQNTLIAGIGLILGVQKPFTKRKSFPMGDKRRS